MPLTTAAQAPADAPEAALLERARTDRDAFGAIYRAHAPAVLGYLRRRTRCAAAAEDLLAETFLRALAAIPHFRSQGVPLRAWLYRIATNLANTWVRRQRVRRALFLPVGDEALKSAAADGSAPSDDGAVRRALAKLSAADQAVLILRFVEELNIEEAAQVLGLPPGTVQSRTARARERLKQLLLRS